MPYFSQYRTSNLTKINQFYSNITIDDEWKNLSEQSDQALWKRLTDKNARDSNNSDQTDSDDDISRNDNFKERELKEPSPLILTAFRLSCIILMCQIHLPMKFSIGQMIRPSNSCFFYFIT